MGYAPEGDSLAAQRAGDVQAMTFEAEQEHSVRLDAADPIIECLLDWCQCWRISARARGITGGGLAGGARHGEAHGYIGCVSDRMRVARGAEM